MEAAVRAVTPIVPRDPRVLYYRAVASVMMRQDLEQAERDLESYLADTPRRDDFPPHAAAHDWLGKICEIQGDKGKAIQQYRSALKISPDNRQAKDALRRLDGN